MISVGIDCGLFGSIVALSSTGDILSYADCPTIKQRANRYHFDERGMRECLLPYNFSNVTNVEPFKFENGAKVFIEQQQPMRKEGRVQGVASTAKTMYGFGLWVGMVVGIGLEYDIIPVRDWQKVMHRNLAGEPKARSLAACSRLFPELPVRGPRGGFVDGRADAALLAEYGRRMLNGEII